MIVYLWTAPAADTTAFHRASGVSDDQARACHAAEVLLMTGQACAAYVECAYTAMAPATLSLCYVRTGTGWCARLGPGGQVLWTAYGPASAPDPGPAPADRGRAVLAEAGAGA